MNKTSRASGLAQALDKLGAPKEIVIASLDSEKDYLADRVVKDYLEETGMSVSPYKIGDKVFICSVTLYFVGEVIDTGFGWVKLGKASWVHWTGRLSSLMKTCDLTITHGSRKARTEYVGEVTLYEQGFICSYPWRGELLEVSVQ